MPPHATFTVRARAIILHDGKLLIVKHRPEAPYWALPGGHLEYGELVPQALEREIIEELGVKPDIGELVYVYTFEDKRNGAHPLEFYFEVKNSADFLSLDGLERTHAHEIAEVRWASPDENLNILPPVIRKDFAAGKLARQGIRYVQG